MFISRRYSGLPSSRPGINGPFVATKPEQGSFKQNKINFNAGSLVHTAAQCLNKFSIFIEVKQIHFTVVLCTSHLVISNMMKFVHVFPTDKYLNITKNYKTLNEKKNPAKLVIQI